MAEGVLPHTHNPLQVEEWSATLPSSLHSENLLLNFLHLTHSITMREKNLFLAPLLLSLFMLTSGCATFFGTGTGGVPRGSILTDVQGPVATQNFEMRVQAGELRKGTASAEGYLGLVAQGDASIQAAAKDGGITNIHHIDFKTRSILGLYVEYTTVVYGR